MGGIEEWAYAVCGEGLVTFDAGPEFAGLVAHGVGVAGGRHDDLVGEASLMVWLNFVLRN